ncbi:MAG: ECF transporter S component [Anaerolineae bacterium]
MNRVLSGLLFFLTGLAGLAAFFYPFFLPAVSADEQQAGAMLLTTLLLSQSLGVLLVEVQGQAISAKVVAALGILVAITAVLRFLEVAIPGPGGFSPIFAPIILAGYVFGARFGFLMGTMTLLTSALITGTVGPWLPYQMFAAGWVGLTAGWLPKRVRPSLQLFFLLLLGAFWGLAYGFIMNLYFWPLAVGGDALSYTAGMGWQTAVTRYAGFYLATSLVWDWALGNVLLILVLGRPSLQAMSRFRDRFAFQWEAA